MARSARRGRCAQVVVLLVLVLAGCSKGMAGVYQEVDGVNVIEFRTNGVCYLTAFGSTNKGEYEIDGERVMLKFASGTIVLTKHGDRLDGGPDGAAYALK